MPSKSKKNYSIFKQFAARKVAPQKSIANAFEIAHKIFSVHFKKTPNIKRCDVRVDFAEGLSTQEVVDEINELSSPQIIVWYNGCYGLRKSGVEFFKNCLISPILKQNRSAIFWLIDLTA